jgi:choline-sulfatase
MTRPSTRRRALALLLLGLLGAAAASRPAVRSHSTSANTSPSLLLITIDTLRPDALGWVSGRNATPAIDSLAREGFRFPAAVSPVPLTLPAHASILTGLLPRRHGVRANGQILGDSIPTLAEALRSRGYATAAFISGYPLQKVFGLDRGFQRYDDTLPAARGEGLERSASDTTTAALAWLHRAKPPWFLWVHYYDPHDPYTPPPAFRRPGPRGAYDGEVSYTDSEIRGLVGALDGSKTDALTILAGDHGEGLEDHGERAHGFFIYDTTLLVPMIIRFPGRVPAGESREPARLMDIVPTALELLEVAPIRNIDGISLVPTLSGRRQTIPASFVECRQPWISYGWAPLAGIRDRNWKFISAPRPEPYDLAKDPGETENLVAKERKKLLELKREFDKANTAPETDAGGVADTEALNKLRSLGYLGGGSSNREIPRDLPDPKDRLRERNALSDAESEMAKGNPAAALRQFDAVLATDPRNRYATLRSGVALFQLGNSRAAVLRLEKAVELAPEDPQAHATLADILDQAGQTRGAIKHWMEAARLQPRATGAWSRLGQSLLADGRTKDAVDAFRQAAELDPKNSDLWRSFALAERRAGDRRPASEHLKRAAAISPPDAFHDSGTLGLLLLDLGKNTEARTWLGRCRQGEPDCAEARLRLALEELQAGNTDAARAMLKDALAFDPALRNRAASDPGLAPLLPSPESIR